MSRALALAFAFTCLTGLAAQPALAQAPAAKAAAWKAPRTPFGQPDLSGVWTNATITPLERPAQYKDLVIPEAEAAPAAFARKGRRR